MLRGVRIGELDRRLTIQHEVTTSVSEFNTTKKEWQNLTETWCSFRQMPGREQYQADQLNGVQTVEFTIRYRTDVTRQMRGVCEGNIYDFVSVAEPPGTRRTLLVIRAELHND